MNKRYSLKYIAALFIMICSFCFLGNDVALAAEENVSVTVPSDINIVFNEDGTNSVSDFTVINFSLVPITIEQIDVVENAEWKLVQKGTYIPVDTKELVLEIEDYCLRAGSNEVDILIPENEKKAIKIEVERGAWTLHKIKEKAFDLEIDYATGTKEFYISFDGNGSEAAIDDITAYNGKEVTLPIPKRENYEFEGWMDDEGNLYKDKINMPIGNIHLTAQWKLAAEPYAIYSNDDKSLTFYKNSDSVEIGDVYKNKTVTAIFKGFEENYYNYDEVPWYDYQTQIASVNFEDEIKPKSTAYWFYNCNKCTSINLNNLNTINTTNTAYMFCFCNSLENLTIPHSFNTSNVQDMSGMFSQNKLKTLTLSESFDTSNVENMANMFSGSLYLTTLTLPESFNTSKVENMQSMFQSCVALETLILPKAWDTSNVQNMSLMFGLCVKLKIDCSSWNVKNVTNYTDFNVYTSSATIICPKWVN